MFKHSMGRPRIFGPSSRLVSIPRFDRAPPEVTGKRPILRVSLHICETPSEWDEGRRSRQERLCRSSDRLPRSENTSISEDSVMLMRLRRGWSWTVGAGRHVASGHTRSPRGPLRSVVNLPGRWFPKPRQTMLWWHHFPLRGELAGMAESISSPRSLAGQ
jgi:hypothetical protein